MSLDRIHSELPNKAMHSTSLRAASDRHGVGPATAGPSRAGALELGDPVQGTLARCVLRRILRETVRHDEVTRQTALLDSGGRLAAIEGAAP